MRPGQTHRFASRLLKPIGCAAKLPELICASLGRGRRSRRPPPVVFIVGAPRSGTTLAFQCLTHRLDVYFPDHLCALFPQAPVSALFLTSLLRRRPHAAFRSLHGFSLGDGLRGPNEWETFFRFNFHARVRSGWRPHPSFSRFLRALNRWGRRPLVVKTLNASLLIRPISGIIPTAKFLWVDREPVAVARSIYRAKRLENRHPLETWYVTPDAMRNNPPSDEAFQICWQIREIRRTIADSFANLAPARRKKVDYHALCSSPRDQIDEIRQWIEQSLKIRRGSRIPNLRPTTSEPLLNAEMEHVFLRQFGST